MKKRAFKQYIFKAMKWMFLFALIYIMFVLSRANSQQNETKNLSDNPQTTVSENLETDMSQTKRIENLSNDLSPKTFPSNDINDSLMTGTDLSKKIEHASSNELCSGITFPSQLLVISEDDWQPVDESKTVYVISAYYIKEKSSVFVLGVRPIENVSVLCYLWRDGEETMGELIEEIKAKETPFFEYRGYAYTATVFQCPVSSSTRPTHVSLVKKKCDSPTNVLRIRSATKELPYQRRLTVCLSPLILNFDATLQFVEWVEIHKLLGVQKFVVYNYSCSANTDRLLKHYSSQGLIEVVQWKPPFAVRYGDIHSPPQLEKYGAMDALNDCLFRNKPYSEFISNLDVNEYIIPRAKDASLTDMLSSLRGNVAAYYINMAFIERNVTKSENTTETLTESEKTKTSVSIEHMGTRISKMIIRTSDVEFSFPRYVPGVETFIVPPEQSVLHIHPDPHLGEGQALGTLIEKVLQKTLMDKVQEKVHTVRTSLPNVEIR